MVDAAEAKCSFDAALGSAHQDAAANKVRMRAQLASATHAFADWHAAAMALLCLAVHAVAWRRVVEVATTAACSGHTGLACSL